MSDQNTCPTNRSTSALAPGFFPSLHARIPEAEPRTIEISNERSRRIEFDTVTQITSMYTNLMLIKAVLSHPIKKKKRKR